MARKPNSNFDFASVTVEDTDAPASSASTKYETHPLADHLLASYESDQWKAITVPNDAVTTTKGALNGIAKAYNIGVRIRVDKDKTESVVNFLGKIRKGTKPEDVEETSE